MAAWARSKRQHPHPPKASPIHLQLHCADEVQLGLHLGRCRKLLQGGLKLRLHRLRYGRLAGHGVQARGWVGGCAFGRRHG